MTEAGVVTVAQWVQRSSGEFLISVKSHSFSPGPRPVTGHDQTTGVTPLLDLHSGLSHLPLPYVTYGAQPGQ